MKFSINRKELLRILSKAYTFTDITKTAEFPRNAFKVSVAPGKLAVLANNTSCLAQFSGTTLSGDDSFEFGVNASKFYDVINNWQSEEINFSFSSNKINLSSGKKKASMSTYAEIEYFTNISVAEEEDFSVDSQFFQKEVNSVAFAAEKNAHDMTHRCVLLQAIDDSSMLIAAYSGIRIASIILDISICKDVFRVAVEGDSLMRAVNSFEPEMRLGVFVSNGRVALASGDDCVAISTVGIKYPDVFRARDPKYPIAFKINTEEIKGATKLLLSVIKDSEKPRVGRFTGTEDGIQIIASSETDEMEQSISAEQIEGDKLVELKGFDMVYFAECARGGEQVVLRTGNSTKEAYLFETIPASKWQYHLLASR